MLTLDRQSCFGLGGGFVHNNCGTSLTDSDSIFAAASGREGDEVDAASFLDVDADT